MVGSIIRIFGDFMSEFVFGNKSLPLGGKTYIMGILNVTPDSFSDGGEYFSVYDAVRQTEKMIEQGADIIDVGAVSTRPFSDKVSVEEEWMRLAPVLDELRKRFDVPISVDTFNPENIKRSLESGADIINDVGGIFSSMTAEYVRKYNAGWIIMHGGVLISDAGEQREYPCGIINDVNAFFEGMLKKIEEYNIPLNNICLDAGFGFSKNTEQNIQLLKNFEKIRRGQLPLLCALSRKRFIGELSGESEARNRDSATAAANIAAVSKGADIVRVHNVALAKQTLGMADALLR